MSKETSQDWLSEFQLEMEQPKLFGLLMQVWQGKEIEDRNIRNFMMEYDEGIKGQFNKGDNND